MFAGLIAEKGFRIEDVTHRYDYIGPDAERGFVIFTIQCASPEAEKCLKHYDEFTAGLNSEAKAKLNDYSITVVSVSVSLGRPMFDC